MNNSPITFCIGSSNNLEYLKLAIHSVRTYSYFKDAPFVIFAENCMDGTYKWLTENTEKYNLSWYREDNIEEITKGIGGGMNFCADKVQTEFIMFLHADMFVSTNWDINALKIFEKYPNIPMWVSSHRIQPNVFNEESYPGTLVVPRDYIGEYSSNFDEATFISFSEEFSNLNDIEIRKGEGVSGLIRKKDWDFIGGNDPRFNPSFFDDMDLFIRMQNKGYKFVLTSKSVVYHFGGRSKNSHFPTDDFQHRSIVNCNYEQRSSQRFIQKWGQSPQKDENRFIIPIKKIKELSKLAKNFKTDKGIGLHEYTEIYDDYFSSLKNIPMNILEIGIFEGESLKLWESYFLNSNIIGLDINEDCSKYSGGRKTIYIGSQTDESILNQITKNHSPLSIIIDDGSHNWDHQIITFKIAFQLLKPGGLYFIEDLHTSYANNWAGGTMTCVNFLKTLVDDVMINGKSFMGTKEIGNQPMSYLERNIEYIHFYKSICVIKKREESI